MKYIIKYKTFMGEGKKTLEANTKKEVMEKFNRMSRGSNVEIKEVKEIQDKESKKEGSIVLKEDIAIPTKEERQCDREKMLNDTNKILFEQLNKFKDLKLSDKEKALMEIAKNNSLTGIAKTLVQSISMEMMIEKSKEN